MKQPSKNHLREKAFILASSSMGNTVHCSTEGRVVGDEASTSQSIHQQLRNRQREQEVGPTIKPYLPPPPELLLPARSQAGHASSWPRSLWGNFSYSNHGIIHFGGEDSGCKASDFHRLIRIGCFHSPVLLLQWNYLLAPVVQVH